MLAALGSLLARMDNFVDVTNRLRTAGAKEAWGVIEAVLSEILVRERGKLTEKLEGQISVDVPDDAYNQVEQLTLLNQYVHRLPLTGTGRVALRGVDQSKYQEMVEQILPDHPFIRQREFGNDVLGSVVIAHSIIEDTLRLAEQDRAAALSRQPFLWRALGQRVGEDALLDGAYVGFVLNSYWNDPMGALDKEVSVVSSGSDYAFVDIPSAVGGQAVFSITLPLTLFAQVKRCEIDVSNAVKLVGGGPKGSASVFFVRETVSLTCQQLEVDADTLRFTGRAWFEAESVVTSPRLNLHVNGSSVGWGGALRQRYPWNRHPSTVLPRYEEVVGDPLVAMIVECARRLRAGTSVTVHPNLKPAADDPQMRWVNRRFSSEFPALLDALIKHGHANRQPVPAAGQGRVRVRFDFAWDELLGAITNPSKSPSWTPLVDELRRTLG